MKRNTRPLCAAVTGATALILGVAAFSMTAIGGPATATDMPAVTVVANEAPTGNEADSEQRARLRGWYRFQWQCQEAGRRGVQSGQWRWYECRWHSDRHAWGLYA